MINFIFERYAINIIDEKDRTSLIRVHPLSNTAEAMEKQRRKLYIIHNEKEIFYVGEAQCSVKKRLQRGCTSFNYFVRNKKARDDGYKGYKWLDRKANPIRELKMFAVIFDKEFDGKLKRQIIEAIEGEVVYLIRDKDLYWPKFQNEIHFNNSTDAFDTAQRILATAFEGSPIYKLNNKAKK